MSGSLNVPLMLISSFFQSRRPQIRKIKFESHLTFYRLFLYHPFLIHLDYTLSFSISLRNALFVILFIFIFPPSHNVFFLHHPLNRKFKTMLVEAEKVLVSLSAETEHRAEYILRRYTYKPAQFVI